MSDLSYSYASPGTSACSTAPATGADTGLRWSQTDNVSGKVTSYCYDHANRLTAANISGGDSWAFTYDSNGNRLTTTKNGATVQTRTVNNADQLTSTGYSYDGAGNTATDYSTNSSFTYNGADQMTKRSDTYVGTDTDYTYTGTTQDELVDQTGRNYTYGRTSGQGLPLVESFTASGSTYSYLYDPQGTPLAMEGSQTHYLALDGLGSPVALTNQSGATTGTYTYDPYGQMTATAAGGSGATGVQLYSFAGGLDDPTSSLEHFGRRWYDPTTGRFTQQDDVQTLADPRRANRYEYAGDNPTNYVDPTGQDFFDYVSYVGHYMADGIVGGFATGCGAAILETGPPGCLVAGTTVAFVGAVGGFIVGTYDYFTD